MRKCNFLAWEWIDVKLYVKWKYLLCSVDAHTVFLLCTARMQVKDDELLHAKDEGL